MRVYLAGPITGSSYGTVTEWRDILTERLKGTAQCLSPMRMKQYLSKEKEIADSYANTTLSNPRAITTRDRWDAMRCDILVVNFLGATKVSIGTILEIAWADSKRIPIILIMEDDNIHKHSMVMECAGFVVKTLEEAALVVEALVG